MEKLYVYTQNGRFWNREHQRLVDLTDATVYTQAEFLRHVKFLNQVNGVWIELTCEGARVIDRQVLVDDIARKMRKMDQQKLLDFIYDNLELMITDDLLANAYHQIVNQNDGILSIFQENIKKNIQLTPNLEPSGTVNVEQPESPKPNGVIFPKDGIQGEVRVLNDGKRYRYTGNIWLPVPGIRTDERDLDKTKINI
jgi:hypothetical protein